MEWQNYFIIPSKYWHLKKRIWLKDLEMFLNKASWHLGKKILYSVELQNI